MNDIPKTSEAAGVPSNDWQSTAERLFDCSAKLERDNARLREALKDARKTSVFEKHPFRPWHDKADAALLNRQSEPAEQNPMKNHTPPAPTETSNGLGSTPMLGSVAAQEHLWNEVGYWYCCTKCGAWKDAELLPKCEPAISLPNELLSDAASKPRTQTD